MPFTAAVAANLFGFDQVNRNRPDERQITNVLNAVDLSLSSGLFRYLVRDRKDARARRCNGVGEFQDHFSKSLV